MKCFNCNTTKATSYYSPKEITKYKIAFCYQCLNLIKGLDLRYIEQTDNQEYAHQEVKRLIKRR